ncbi:MAG: hypothetical protein V8T10_01530 [Merdibacter sp.]
MRWYVGEHAEGSAGVRRRSRSSMPFVYAAYGFGEAQRWQARISAFAIC